MSATLEEFIAFASLPYNIVNVTVWYIGSAPNSQILGVAVPIIDDEGNEHTNILAGVEEIVLPLPIVGTQAILTVDTRQIIRYGTPITSSYLFTVTPYNTDSIITQYASGTLIFSPDVNNIDFLSSPYNAVVGTVMNNRTSMYIMSSERNKIGGSNTPSGYTGPLNIYSLLNETATPATVQDSNYTSTGWTNGRYEGSKTNEEDYKTLPAIGGRIFKGAAFATTTLDAKITTQMTQNQVAYRSYFYSGEADTPGFSYKDSFFSISGSTTYPSSSADFFVKLKSNINPPDLLTFKVGQLIRVGDNANSSENGEVMKILRIGKRENASQREYTLGVERLIGGNPVNTQTNNQFIDTLSQVTIYDLVKNKLVGVAKGKILIQETGGILVVDNKGTVVSGSF